MKMHVKLGIIFSAITIVLTAAFTVFSLSAQRNSLYRMSEENLVAVGSRMAARFDEYVETLDYTLKGLIANADLMDALAMQTYLSPTIENQAALLEGRNLIAQVLQRDPLNTRYHRINIFNRNGLFYSSRLGLADNPTLSAQQVQRRLAQIPWLDQVDASPFAPVLLAPYTDPWGTGEGALVFGIGRAVVWVGHPSGYLEIQAAASQLERIFAPEGLNGVQVCALIQGDRVIYQSGEETAQAARAYFTHQEGQSPSHLYECHFSGQHFGLQLYISQDISAWNQEVWDNLQPLFVFCAVALVTTIAVIATVSRQLTSSVRVLEKNMQSVIFEETAILPEGGGLKKGNEIYRLQSAFEELILRLNHAIHNEMQARDLHLQAQLNALQAQINPHFIYNTLNVIMAKSVEHGAMDIADICGRFSDMLRYSTNTRSQTVRLRDEIAHATNYLELMKARYERRLTYTIKIPQELMDAELPRLTIQPLVENCFAHGYKDCVKDMSIRIDGWARGKGFVLRIADNGAGFPPETLAEIKKFLQQLDNQWELQQETQSGRSSIGLANTFTRLYLFCKGGIRFTLYNEQGAVVELSFSTGLEA